MSRPVLNAHPRTETGKSAARKLRAQGQVPAVVYGSEKQTVALAVSPKEVAAILNGPAGRNTPLDLQIEGEGAPRLTVIRDFTYHPWKRNIEHVDFWEVQPDTVLVADVPLERVGVAPAEKAGSRVRFVQRTIKLKATPANMPASIVVDMTGITEDMIKIMASELTLPEGATVALKNDFAVVQVRKPRAEKPKAGEEAVAEGGVEAEGEGEAAAEAEE